MGVKESLKKRSKSFLKILIGNLYFLRPYPNDFHQLRVHNTDDDVGLDGLELYKAIHHAKQHDASQDGMATNDEDPTEASHDKTMGMVDSLLEQFDVNEDGILDFSEFMKSFVQARHDLGL